MMSLVSSSKEIENVNGKIIGSYAQQRINNLNPSAGQNRVECWLPGCNEPRQIDILSSDQDGNLLIHYLQLEKNEGYYVSMSYDTSVPDAYTEQERKATVAYVVTRLAKPRGDHKYDNPKDIQAQPFLTTRVIDAYNNGTTISTLILLEGQLKAFAGAIRGLDIIGINGIWGMRGKGSKELHPVIKKIVDKCRVQNLVYMQDGDCRLINEYDAYKDLTQRPTNFANCVMAFREACRLLKNNALQSWFCHVNEDQPKGLDDLLIQLNGQHQSAIQELQSLVGGRYFSIYNLQTWDKAKTKEYFYIDKPQRFYDKHSDLLQDNPFLYGKDYWQYNEDNEDEPLTCILPGVVKDFVLVGGRYYHEFYDEKRIENLPFFELNRMVTPKENITDEFARCGIKEVAQTMLKIPKYAAFRNEPDFLDYKKEFTVSVHNRTSKFLNLAYPIEHIPKEGEWKTIEGFLIHIFTSGGEDKLSVALDMIQMYYLMPKQKQRVMALVSKANETGKSTFLILLRYIFGQNMAIIRNADLESQFNGYVVKSLGGVDEGKITDAKYVEMLKSLITMPTVNLNDKNVSVREVETHFKLIMTTNHINDFIQIDEAENKWFVVEVGDIKKKDSSLVSRMIEEIPAFLWYLQHRTMVHRTKESRFGIADKAVETQALLRIKENSQPQLKAMIRDYIKTRFLQFDEREIRIDALRLYEQLFPEKTNRYSNYDIVKCLKTEFGMEPGEKPERSKIPVFLGQEDDKVDIDTGEVVESEMQYKWMSFVGKQYTFKPGDFLQKSK